MMTLAIFTLASVYELRPQVQAVARFDRHAPLAFSFKITNRAAVLELHQVKALCNVSLIADEGDMVDDAKLFPSPTTLMNLQPASSRAYVCRANFKTVNPSSVHLAVFVNYEQHLIPGHPWKRTVWVPFHVVMDSEETGRWISGN